MRDKTERGRVIAEAGHACRERLNRERGWRGWGTEGRVRVSGLYSAPALPSIM